MTKEILHEVYFLAASSGVTLEKNRVTLYRHRGCVSRWQVYSERAGKQYNDVFQELDRAVEIFVELSQ